MSKYQGHTVTVHGVGALSQNKRHFCFILSMGTKIRIDSVMRPRSSSRGRNTSASVTVTVTVQADK